MFEKSYSGKCRWIQVLVQSGEEKIGLLHLSNRYYQNKVKFIFYQCLNVVFGSDMKSSALLYFRTV